MISEENFELRLLGELFCVACVRHRTAELYREATSLHTRTRAHARNHVHGYPSCIYLFEKIRSPIMSYVVVSVVYMLL